MKTGLLFFTLLILTSTCTMAQTNVGGFIGYGSDVGQVGIGGIGEFSLNDKWALSPSLLFYFPESTQNLRFSWMELNINANYYFYNEGAVNIYGLSGMNYMRYRVREKFGSERYYTNGEVGLNIGMGATFDVGKKVKPFTEIKFVIGAADQLALFFGLKYSL